MKAEAKLRLPKMTGDEALKIHEGFLHEHIDLVTGGFEIKKVDRKRSKR